MNDALTRIDGALTRRLAALVLDPVIPIGYENSKFVPPADGSGYMVVNLLPASPDNPTMGDSFYREQGILQVTLSFPSIGGAGPARVVAESVRDWFRRGLSFSSGGVTVTIGSTPAIAPGRVVQDRYLVPVSISYFANIG